MSRNPLILVWAVPKKLKGTPGITYVTYAIAEDGSPLSQCVVESRAQARIALGVDSTLRHERYAEEYPLGFDVVWLDDHEMDARWWRARFFSENRWEITFVLGPLLYVEFRDERSRRVIGHVAHLSALNAYYVVPGRATPRSGDTFPEPAMSLSDAMREAHVQFLPVVAI